jgi:hypothetical protein
MALLDIEPAAFQPEGHTDQRNQNRHFYQRANHRGESNRRNQAEGGNGYGNRQFKVVTCGGESQCGGAWVGCDSYWQCRGTGFSSSDLVVEGEIRRFCFHSTRLHVQGGPPFHQGVWHQGLTSAYCFPA